jgi:hypothetical protein
MSTTWVIRRRLDLFFVVDEHTPRACPGGNRAPGRGVDHSAGIETVKSPLRSRCRNWVGTVRAEVTDRMLIADPRHLRAVLDEYVAHHNRHLPHRARDLRPPDSGDSVTVRSPIW